MAAHERRSTGATRTRIDTEVPSPATLTQIAVNPYAPFSPGSGEAWWDQPSRLSGDRAWSYPYFPNACYQRDRRAGGERASAWQVLWAYPDDKPNRVGEYRTSVRRSVRAAQSVFAASARRYIVDQDDLFTRSLAPRFVTTSTCRVSVKPVQVPSQVYHFANYWGRADNAMPYGPGSLTTWLTTNGYNQPNRKYLVLLQSRPHYPHLWAGISENRAAGPGNETPTLDNAANYTSHSYVDASFMFPTTKKWGVDLDSRVQVIAHEMAHALGAMTDSSPHDNPANPMHPSDCWDLLCYAPPTDQQTYANGCGKRNQWSSPNLARDYMRLDCNRDDYWAPATDTGLIESPWTQTRWAASSSSFLYGNPQPTPHQLAARAPKHSEP